MKFLPGNLRVFLPLFVFLWCSAAFGQFRAAVQGTILDASGAVVPNANVTLRNEETGVEQKTTSGPEGFYRFQSLAPGRYTIAAEAPNFKRAVKEHVEVRAEQLEGVDITMNPGEISESVTVSAESGPQLQTENATIAGTISREQVVRLPQVGRDPYELLRLAPGVFGTGARNASGNSVAFPNSAGPGGSNNSIFQTENQVPISANGQRVTANSYEIDGVNVNSQAWGGAAVITPNQESVKEIHVISSAYSAETGRNTGAVVQVVSQNGTNTPHGSFFGKFNRPELNAFNRWGGPHGEAPSRVENSFNQWGGSVGGPIVPNHLFFFFSYERIANSSNQITNAWVETPQYVSLVRQRFPNSIAAQVLGLNGMAPRIKSIIPRTCASFGLADPAQCREADGGLDIGSPAGTLGQQVGPMGGGLDGIPDIQYAALPFPQSTTSQQFNGRLDFQATDRDLIAFSSYFVPVTNEFATSQSRPIQQFTSDRLNLNGALLWTHTLTPTMINEARFNVTRWRFNEIQSNPKMPWGVPQSTVADSRFSLSWGPFGPGVFYQTSYDFRDTFSKVLNTHSLRFGVEHTRQQNNDTVAWAARPSYDFGNLWNYANDAPISESGNFDPRNGFPTDLKKYIRSNITGLFVQDDWKVRPSFTLNLGLRWQYFSPLREKYGNLSNLVLGSGPEPLQTAVAKIGGDLYEPDRNNFGPQFGFAFSPREFMGHDFQNRFVVRGGFGIGYNQIPQSLTLNGRLNPPFFGSFFLQGNQVVYGLGTGGINSFYGWQANPATRIAFDPNTNLPILAPGVAKPDVFGVPLDMRTPYTYRYSLDLQYEIATNWVGLLGYQGSTAHKFPRVVNYSLFFDPNPALATTRFIRNDVNINYNALIARLTHRFARGFQALAEYRWSKSIDYCSNEDNCVQTYPFDQRFERGPSDYDVPHLFKFSGIWDLPIFRQRKDPLGFIVGGWSLTGILQANSGFPWTAVYQGDNCNTIRGRGGLCPQRPVAYLGGAGSSSSNDVFMRAGGNFPGGGLAFFVPPPGGEVLAPPVPGIGRNTFRGPRYFDVDMSAMKRFGLPNMPLLGENAGVEIRANAFNVFNKLNLAPFQFNSPSTQINNPDFGRATAALSGRVVEFQARFSF